MDNDRYVLHTIHTDEGALEVYWARSRDDMLIDEYEGSLLFHDDGSITHKCWTDSDIPIVTHMKGNRIVIGVTEDQPFDREGDEVIFDTEHLDRQGVGPDEKVHNYGPRSV